MSISTNSELFGSGQASIYTRPIPTASLGTVSLVSMWPATIQKELLRLMEEQDYQTFWNTVLLCVVVDSVI